MSKQPPDYPVLIPYSELVELLAVSQQIKAYKKEVADLNAQVTALRIIQAQCMEQIKELKKLV